MPKGPTLVPMQTWWGRPCSPLRSRALAHHKVWMLLGMETTAAVLCLLTFQLGEQCSSSLTSIPLTRWEENRS